MEGYRFYFFILISVWNPLYINGNLKPPENVEVKVTGSNVTFSWIITQKIASKVRLAVFNSKGEKQEINSTNLEVDIFLPKMSFETTELTPCQTYYVQAKSHSRLTEESSDVVEKIFWLTARTVTADINKNVTLKWTTAYTNVFKVFSPDEKVVYEVNPGGQIVQHDESGKYQYNKQLDSAHNIEFTVVNVSQTDGGIYKSSSNNHESKTTDECCLLIISERPSRPVLSMSTNHPFVGDNITFTCTSEAQRWPIGIPSSLTYTFFGKGEQRNGVLMINSLTMSDRNVNITCQCVDDLGKVSDISKSITLNPFYGPRDVVILPAIYKEKILIKDETFGPIKCSASCNPECKIYWKRNIIGKFEVITTNGTLFIENVSKHDSGQYRCIAKHPYDENRRGGQTVTLTVLYPPSITKSVVIVNNSSLSTEGTEFLTFKEGDHVQVNLTIDSNPAVILTLNISGIPMERLNFNHSFKVYTFQLPLIKCEQSQHLMIEANNGIKENARWIKTLNILCQPKEIDVSRQIIGTQIDSLENISLVVVSNPKPNITWDSKSDNLYPWNTQLVGWNQYMSSSSMKVRRQEDFRQYTLRIWNEINVMFVNITLTAKVKLSISKCLIRVNGASQETGTSYTFNEGNHVQVILTIDSNPAVTSIFLSFGAQKSPLSFNQSDSDYTCQLPPLKCENSGTFNLSASNGVKEIASRSLNLNIQCPPQKIQGLREQIGTQLGATESISVLVISNPQPTIKWHIQSDNLGEWKSLPESGYQYNISSWIKIRTESDFRQYSFLIKNTVNETFLNVNIMARGAPELPRNFQIETLTSREVALSWIAEFDGGDKQNFTISFRDVNNEKWNSIHIPTIDTRKGNKIHYILTGLLPKTLYNVNLVAGNKYGRTGNISIQFQTKDSSTTTWIIACLTAFVVVVIAVFTHILRTYRQRSRDRNPVNKTHSQDNISDEVHGWYEEIDDTALNNVPMQVGNKNRNVIIDNASSGSDGRDFADSNRTDNKSLNAEQERTSYEHPYHSLEENWRCNAHAYDVAMISQLKSYENVVDLGNTYELKEGNMTAHVQEYVNTADTTTRVLSQFMKTST